jgi:hypothetical protein
VERPYRHLVGDAAMQACHDVSFQKDDHDGAGRKCCGRGRTVRTTIVPPQQGQRSFLCVVTVSWFGSASGSDAGTASNRRQNASFLAR